MMDRISNLPDEIVCQILSFLSTKETALTSVLSKRWRNMFVFTSNLSFEDNDYQNHEVDMKSFTDFVDRVLAVAGNLPIKKFSLNCQESAEIDLVKSLISKVLKHGVIDLYITAYSLPLEFLTCKTLVKLKLGRGFDTSIVPKNKFLPALKTLFLDYVYFSEDSGSQLVDFLSACPVLEELTIHYDQPGWSCRVSSMTLQRLIINCKADPFDDSGSIIFDTPSLAYLDYSGFVQNKYPIVNLNPLVKANLTLDSMSNPPKLLQGLRNVEILNLSSLETSEILYAFRGAIPVFGKLSRLSIATEEESCWKLVPLLLEKSPNLETLVIKGPLHYCYNYNTWLRKSSSSVCKCVSGYSFLWSCSVKVLEITEYCGMTIELEIMKHFLEILQCLELVKVHACAKSKFQFDKDLLMLPFAHKIQFKFYPYKLTTASECEENIVFPMYGFMCPRIFGANAKKII